MNMEIAYSGSEGFDQRLWSFRPGLLRLAGRLASLDALGAESVVDGALALAQENAMWLSLESEASCRVWLCGMLATLLRGADVMAVKALEQDEDAPGIRWEVVFTQSLRLAVAELPLGLREVFLMASRRQSRGEMARRLGISPDEVRERLTEARSALRERLQRRFPVHVGEGWLQDFIRLPD